MRLKSYTCSHADNSKQSSHIPVFIRILDINDHAPEFAMYYETFVCENAKPGQVSYKLKNIFPFTKANNISLIYLDFVFFMKTIVSSPCHFFISHTKQLTIILKL